MASSLLCIAVMCMMLRNLCINCSVLMSVIYDLRCCLFECQSVLTNDLKLTRFYDMHAAMLLYLPVYCGFYVARVSKYLVAVSTCCPEPDSKKRPDIWTAGTGT